MVTCGVHRQIGICCMKGFVIPPTGANPWSMRRFPKIRQQKVFKFDYHYQAASIPSKNILTYNSTPPPSTNTTITGWSLVKNAQRLRVILH